MTTFNAFLLILAISTSYCYCYAANKGSHHTHMAPFDRNRVVDRSNINVCSYTKHYIKGKLYNGNNGSSSGSNNNVNHNALHSALVRSLTSILALCLILNPFHATASALGSSSSSTIPQVVSIGKYNYNSPPPFPSKGYQTVSGLKYFDLKEGDINVSPLYGQLVSFHYTGYYRPAPGSPFELFDSSHLPAVKTPFLHKHGNGRVIRGIDEALHTMKVGGIRRAIIPKSLGYTDIGIGPVPSEPKYRKILGDRIDDVNVDKGELIFDLELLLVADDENDQGYYDDVAISQEDVRKIILKSLQFQPPSASGTTTGTAASATISTTDNSASQGNNGNSSGGK